MSSIHYKFRATVELKTVRFDGLHVLCSDLKRKIYSNENIKVESFDLILTNAQTRRSYVDNEPVPRNTTIIVQRVPKEGAEKAPKIPKGNGGLIMKSSTSDGSVVNPNVIGHLDQVDLDNMTEEERQAHVVAVSTSKYDQSNYVKRIRNTVMSGPPPTTYVCNRCNQTGHWYQNCPMANTRKATGMTMDELLVTTADDPHALLHSSGRYVVPKMHHLARQQQKRPSVEAPEEKTSPENIVQRVRIGLGPTVSSVQPAIRFPGSTSQLTQITGEVTQITGGGFHQPPPVLLDTSVPPPNFTIPPTSLHMTLPSSAVPVFNMSVPPPSINLHTPNYANFGAQHGHYMGHTAVKQELPPGIDDYCGGLSMEDRRWSTVGCTFSSTSRRRSSRSSRSRSRSPVKRRSRKKDRKHSKKRSHQSRSSRSEQKHRRHRSTSQEGRRKTKKKDRKDDDREERKSRRSQDSDGETEDRGKDQVKDQVEDQVKEQERSRKDLDVPEKMVNTIAKAMSPLRM
ncbi:unnamed protein product, partial [Mesorhabditis belari]|uniref:Uncharacterized protein n=1 Tax=Mesorhabditis belari TaxID=2138241 RepID=A0AAF3ESW9_9BILA